jgi:hypothetical protein
MLIVQISFGNNAGAATGAARSNFLGLNSGYEAEMLISQISWVKVLVMVQQALVTQISWVKMLVFKRQTLVIQH